MEVFSPTLALAAILAFVAFGQWLRQQRRTMIHQERLAALEKGLELPPLEQEALRTTWNVQLILLLAGLVWVSVGIGFYLVFSTMLAHPNRFTEEVPHGIQFVGVGIIGIGVSHLIAYAVGRNRNL